MWHSLGLVIDSGSGPGLGLELELSEDEDVEEQKSKFGRSNVIKLKLQPTEDEVIRNTVYKEVDLYFMSSSLRTGVLIWLVEVSST
jgi:hypothetical protein